VAVHWRDHYDLVSHHDARLGDARTEVRGKIALNVAIPIISS